jgi:Protein of unknown function with PCYCGC motif
MIASAAAIVIVLIAVGAWAMRSTADSSLAKTTSATLDPMLFNGQAREAYEIAAKEPKLLKQLHCFCGCDKHWHRNLLDCYRTKHASICPVCMGEAFEAARLAKDGLPVAKIKRALSDDYGHGG